MPDPSPEEGGHRNRRAAIGPRRAASSRARRRAGMRGSRSREDPPETPATEGAAAAGPRTRVVQGAALRRIWESVRHPGRGQLIAAVILFVVGFAGVMQVRANAADDTYSTARREDLVQLLDGIGSESRRLEGEIAQLERTRTSLQSGADTQRVAREEVQKRVEVLSVLAGTVPAEGPGIRMRIADPSGHVDADVLLNAVEEMRDAGAEVIEVNNTVRVVASSWIGMDARGLVIDGTLISSPITIEVIGEPRSLAEAAKFRGGLVSEITGPQIGGQVQIEELNRVVVESLHAVQQNQYAQPASPPPTPR